MADGFDCTVNETERALVRAAMTGNDAAFERLALDHAPRAWKLACLVTPDPEVAEEIVQEVCETARRELALLPSSNDFALWFCDLAVHACLRRAAKAPVRAVPGSPLGEALAHVAPEDRLAFVLRDVEGLPWREVAWIFDEAVPDARRRVHRARLALCTLVDDESPEPALKAAPRRARPLVRA